MTGWADEALVGELVASLLLGVLVVRSWRAAARDAAWEASKVARQAAKEAV